MMVQDYHKPALLFETLYALKAADGGVFVDCTFGGGGHSRGILEANPLNRVFAFDKDPDAHENAPGGERFVLVKSDFRFLEIRLREIAIAGVDGILADLGVSSHQFDTADRGFSFRFDAELDMRMDPAHPLTAAEILANYPEDDLRNLFRTYGEVPFAGKLASEIVKRRKTSPVRRTGQLEELLRIFVPSRAMATVSAQVYQALRIEVNDEMGALKELLNQSVEMLKPGGRLAIISYHSLEDRMVKHHFRSGNVEDVQQKDMFGNIITPWRVITRKALQPSWQEIEENPRVRSARLRVAERVSNGKPI